MVEKILAYESSGFIECAPVELVADDPDEAGDFERDAEEIASEKQARLGDALLAAQASYAQSGAFPEFCAFLTSSATRR